MIGVDLPRAAIWERLEAFTKTTCGKLVMPVKRGRKCNRHVAARVGWLVPFFLLTLSASIISLSLSLTHTHTHHTHLTTAAASEAGLMRGLPLVVSRRLYSSSAYAPNRDSAYEPSTSAVKYRIADGCDATCLASMGPSTWQRGGE